MLFQLSSNVHRSMYRTLSWARRQLTTQLPLMLLVNLATQSTHLTCSTTVSELYVPAAGTGHHFRSRVFVSTLHSHFFFLHSFMWLMTVIINPPAKCDRLQVLSKYKTTLVRFFIPYLPTMFLLQSSVRELRVYSNVILESIRGRSTPYTIYFHVSVICIFLCHKHHQTQ